LKPGKNFKGIENEQYIIRRKKSEIINVPAKGNIGVVTTNPQPCAFYQTDISLCCWAHSQLPFPCIILISSPTLKEAMI
jgi:predicted ATPase with chaperone activity